MDDNTIFTPDEEQRIRKLIAQQQEIDTFRLQTRDQLPLGLLSYGFAFEQIAEYIPGTSLPYTASFDIKHGRNAVFFAAGSGFHSTGSAVIGVDISVDGALAGAVTIYANPALTHLAFVPRWFRVENLTIGQHSCTITAQAGTQVDVNDHLTVAMLEIP